MDSVITYAAEFAAEGILSGIGQFIAGVFVVAFLIGAFWLGRRIRAKEPPPPKPEEQPHRPPDAGLPGEEEGHRRPAELEEREDRLMPYELKHESTEPDTTPLSEADHKWRGAPSGGFGSGGPTTGGG